jgi:DNA gyrase subunit A
MAVVAEEINPVNIEDELKKSYLDYAMSVIVGRALPDVRDGLKPVHRRVLYAMKVLGNDWNKPYKKSARIVGDVIGKYHPHGDGAVYDALVRMAQDFSMRYTLIDGQGNFGSVDGDPAAAMRYTEVRMAKIAYFGLLADLDKETVDFVPNYDESEFQPAVLPAQMPNLIINGSSGIAVGMATNIPPHNLSEVLNGCIALIDNPHLTIEQLMEYIPGPDFPTAGFINGRAGILQAYKTGKGRIHIRAKTEIEVEPKSGRQAIIINELPYQVNKARLIEKIAELVRHKKIEGIAALRDESDKVGMRVVIEIKRGETAEVTLNNLFAQTQLQTVFGVNLVALVDNQPRLLNLHEILSEFIRHRRQIVSRRTEYDLRKARERAHVLEGLSIALASIDLIINMIKKSPSPVEAKDSLMNTVWSPGMVAEMLEKSGFNTCRPRELEDHYGLLADGYHLSPAQAQAILDLRLHRLTGLEQDKILVEYTEIIAKINEYLDILADQNKLMQVIKSELMLIKAEFGDARKTELISSQHDFTVEDLIDEENMVVTLSHSGYIKCQLLNSYQAQKRGGKGKSAARVKDEDYITKLLIANTHDTLLCFSSLGKMYWLKVHQIPVASRIAKGRPIINLLPLEEKEVINAVLPIREYKEDYSIFMATSDGTVKRTVLTEFSRPRSNGIIAIDLEAGNELIGVELTDGSNDILLSTNSGKAICFPCSDVRCVGRLARGVRGIKLQPKQKVISLIVLQQDGAILTATKNGYGKRTLIEEYKPIARGGSGVISIQTSERNGEVIGACQVYSGDELMLISDQGTLVRTRVDEISLVGRNTQGVRLINLAEEEHLVGIQRIVDVDVDLAQDDTSQYKDSNEQNDDLQDPYNDDVNIDEDIDNPDIHDGE